MIPQRKPALPDPWGHVETRRPAANDTQFADLDDDGKTEKNLTMFLASLSGIFTALVVLFVSGYFAAKAIHANWAATRGVILSIPPHFYAIALVSLVALCVVIAAARRALRARRASRDASLRRVARAVRGAGL